MISPRFKEKDKGALVYAIGVFHALKKKKKVELGKGGEDLNGDGGKVGSNQ